MPKILHVEAFSAPNARENAGGLFAAFERRASAAKRFDYRRLVSIKNAGVMNAELIRTVIEFKPDLIFLGKCESVAGTTIARIKAAIPSCTIFHWFGDGRDVPPAFVGDIGRHVDATLMQCADQEYFDKYLAAGCTRIETWIGGYNPDVIYPHPCRRVYEAVFMGGLAGGTGSAEKEKVAGRREMLRLLVAGGVQVDVFGGPANVLGATYHQRVYGKDFSVACGKARFALSYCANYRHLYHSWPRIIKTLGCGLLLFVRRFPGLDTLFENQRHLVWFDDLSELLHLAKYYLAHEEEAGVIGAAGLELVREKYTYDCMVSQVLELMK